MKKFTYLIIGGGMTADAAVHGIRAADPSGSIGLISSEAHAPYRRPPLSKGLWKGEEEKSIWLSNAAEHAELHLSTTAITIRPDQKEVIDDRGQVYSYKKLLLATGGKVRTFPSQAEGIIYYRSLDDYQKVRSLTAHAKQIVVIGGGFIGSEVAAALAMNRQKVTMIFPDNSIGSRVYPARLSAFLNEYYETKGVEVLAQTSVSRVDKRGSTYHITTGNGKLLEADVVITGIGIQPDVSLAQLTGLKVENGIVVNENLQTSAPDIYAAGDVANFPNTVFGRMRVEHEDNANTMGECAGKNMAGATTAYAHLPFFYSDLFDLGYEAVGQLDSRLTVVEDWKEEFREGVIYYMDKNLVRGVLLWNTWGQVENARKMILSGEKVDPAALKGRLPQ